MIEEQSNEFCFTIVHATAHFENSSNSKLTEDDLRSIYKFIVCEIHLVANIKNIAIDIKTEPEAFVKKAMIQEAAKDYIQKHFGGINY